MARLKYTQNYNLKKPEGTDLVNIDDLNYNADIIDAKLKTNADTISQHINAADPHPQYLPKTLKMEKFNKDSNGIYTQVDYKREDGTLYMRSVLSGGTSPQYTTRTITLYDVDGTTVLQTITHTLTYDSDGNVVSEA